MNDDLAHADTIRPPAPSPWIDAPTHDGLWWVLDGTGAVLRELQYGYEKNGVVTWWTKTMEVSDDGDYRTLPPSWKFAPAVPPTLP